MLLRQRSTRSHNFYARSKFQIKVILPLIFLSFCFGFIIIHYTIYGIFLASFSNSGWLIECVCLPNHSVALTRHSLLVSVVVVALFGREEGQ